MLKTSTLLSVSIFFLLFMGLSDHGYGCHRDTGEGPIPHGPKGDCSGGGGGGGQGGGDGNQVTPAVITFRDAAGDKIQSDVGMMGSYDTEEFPNGERVTVFIGSKANFGNIFLVGDRGKNGDGSITEPMREGTRTLFLDFSNCVDPCVPPDFVSMPGLVLAGFRVAVDKVVKDGGFGLAVDGEVGAPMRLQFREADDDPFNDNWFLDFDPKNCDGSTTVRVKRTGPNTWEVGGNDPLACLVQSGAPRAEPVGLFGMEFFFTVVIQ